MADNAVAVTNALAAASNAAPAPSFDALAISLSQQNNLIATLALLIGIIAIVAGLGWGILVKLWAESAARDVARDWLEKNAGALLAKMDPANQFRPPEAPSPVASTPPENRPLTPGEQAQELETEGD